MPANSSLTLTALDFDTLKQNFLSWMQSQSTFKDYNFNASSTVVLIDILSYNSYLNAFYLNMTFSEMFLDSAQKIDSVVSHAKELNYLPRSAASSVAEISFTANTVGVSNPFVVPVGTLFTGKNSNGTFTFTTPQTTSYVSSNGYYTVANLVIYEGTFTTDTFVVNTSNTIPTGCLTFLLTNQNIDLSSLTVSVSQDNGANVQTWMEVNTLFGLNGNSQVFFVQAAQNLQYEILFGDGLFGLVPQNGAVVTAKYRIASGPAADGVSNVAITTDLGAYNGGTATLSPITFNTVSQNGQFQQSIESIRFTAPRYYATQDRGVASGDYTALVLDQFGGLVEDVVAYGGELLSPPQYGTVVVCIKPTTGTIASTSLKNSILSYLAPRITLPTTVVITDPDYFYCAVETTVTYDQTLTGAAVATLQSEVVNAVATFTNNNLGTFADSFYYSQFTTVIDAADPAIVSNDTSVYMIKRIVPLANTPFSTTISFNNSAEIISSNVSITRDQVYPITRLTAPPVVWSSTFTFTDGSGTDWPLSVIRDDNFGGLIVMTTVNGVVSVLNQAIGNVAYTTGDVTINGLLASGFDQYVSIYLQTQSPNFTVQQEQIILIDTADVVVTMQNLS